MGVGQNQTALVIGGGIVGLACALQLQRLGLHTTLIEAQAQPQTASYGNAGHIAIEQVEPLASWATIRSAPRRLFSRGGALDVRSPLALAPWLLRFAGASTPGRFEAGRVALRVLLQAATPAWQQLVDDLGKPDLLQMEGHTVLWESQASAQRKRDAWLRADIGSAGMRDLTPAELGDFASLLKQAPVAGLRFDKTGQVADPGLMLQVLRAAFTAAGGHYVHGQVHALVAEDGRAIAVGDDGQWLRADLLLVAAGIGAKPLLAPLGINAPVVAERGYHLQWARHDWPDGLAPVVFEDRSMIVTRFRSGLRAASFVEFAPPQTPADPRKWNVLLAHTTALGLPVHAPPQPWMGARPTLPDYLPAIGRSHALPNLLYAFGHQHLGLTLAPITARIVAAIAAQAPAPVPIAAFDLQRFQ